MHAAAVLALLVSLPLLADALDDADCAPASCGNLTIRYPFWLRGHQPSNCGYPSFGLACDRNGGAPLLNESYLRVLDINYSDSSVVAFHTNLARDTTGCRGATKFNVSAILALSLLTISRANRELFLCGNCSRRPPAEWLQMNCTGYAGAPWFVYMSREPLEADQEISSAGCQYTAMPVMPGSELRAAGDYAGLVRRGFLLEWKVPGDCAACGASGGQCRFDADENAFRCLCPDGSKRPATCARGGSKNKKVAEIVSGSLGAGGGAFVAFVVFFILYKRKRRKQARAPNGLMHSESSMRSYSKDLELGGSPHIFTYEELEEATDGFSESRELGDGGFGTVYKGELRDGRVVAVKRLYKNNYKRVEQFINEVDILSRLLHQNLVILYGCTSRSSRDLMLVYEFIPNGTVADHLHGPRASERGLTWPVRMNIAIETAGALAYLHAVEIIHRDVKTNNILLDNSFHIKVADFGLSRLYPLEVTHVSTVPQGTPGYVDPVYHQCYKLTDKSDVYSFGVVLVELISSKPAVDMGRSHSEINLANMALNRIQNHEVEQLVDPGLGYETDDETKRMIDLVAELAFQCLQLERELRPSIKQVVEALNCIKNGDSPEKRMDLKSSPKEDSHLLQNSIQYSPDSVIHRFHSQSTTHSVASNTSG